ncbi:MAG: hypothetical protein ABJH72_09710 [Reichenbachiella sp.]|uniref:ABC transporter permease n=1 Tax=Reichenbachiella sp. TaxID=2184521 RepID=UPI003264FB1A
MILYKFLLSLSDGLIFSFFGLGIFISFRWLRFPDLTPDGSFVLGGCVYVQLTSVGVPAVLAILISILCGFIAGLGTSLLNQVIRIPAFIAGLLMSGALYSINWLLLGKPNQYAEATQMMGHWLSGREYNHYLILISTLCLASIIFILKTYGDSIWGLRIRAVGENNILSSDLRISKLKQYAIGLGISNGLVALSGAFYVQRTFSADINMGVGQTITGLIGMIIGMLLYKKQKNLTLVFYTLAIGVIIYKLIIWISLELGLPPESFKLISSAIMVILFFMIHKLNMNFLNNLRWV